jgi:hypothetical protein
MGADRLVSRRRSRRAVPTWWGDLRFGAAAERLKRPFPEVGEPALCSCWVWVDGTLVGGWHSDLMSHSWRK